MVITANEEFISPEEVGERLGVSVYTVRRWVKEGKLRAFKPGKEYRIQESDLEEFLRTREVRPKAPRRSPSERSFNDVLEEERRSRFAEMISTAADKWAETMTAPDTDPKIVAGVVDAILDLHAVIRTFLEDEKRRRALTNEEGDEIIAVLRQLHETASVGVRRLEVEAEDAGQEQEAKRMREQIRQWTKQLSA